MASGTKVPWPGGSSPRSLTASSAGKTNDSKKNNKKVGQPMEANQRFGSLTTVRKVTEKGQRSAWLCTCDCGTTKVVEQSNLKQGFTRSCGCLRRKMHAANMAAAFPERAPA